MFKLTYVYVEYETSVSCSHIPYDDRTKMIVVSLFELATPLNSQNPLNLNS